MADSAKRPEESGRFHSLIRLLSAKEVAEALNVSEKTVARIVDDGKIAPVWIRGQRRFHPLEVQAYVWGQMEEKTEDVSEAYPNFFDSPALDVNADKEGQSSFEPDHPEGEPPNPPPLRPTAFPPERAGYRSAFRDAWRYPNAILLVMRGICKGLKRGKLAVEHAAEQRVDQSLTTSGEQSR